MEGVEKVEVDFAKKVATVTMKPGKTLEREKVEEALKQKKYGVTKFEERAAPAGS